MSERKIQIGLPEQQRRDDSMCLMILESVDCKQGQEYIYSINNFKLKISIHIWGFHSLSFKSENSRCSIEPIGPKVLKTIMSSGNQAVHLYL